MKKQYAIGIKSDGTEIRFTADSTKLLDISSQDLISIDISNCKDLRTLYCSKNQLTSLDVRNCKNLRRLDCSDNQLTSLDVRNCKVLRELYCSDNQLTSLDVRNCKVLRELYCSDNQLTSIDVRNCKVLRELYCSDNQLTSYVNNCGNEDRTISSHWVGDDIKLSIGCFFGSKEEAIDRINEKYSGSDATEYIKKVEQCYNLSIKNPVK